jgi:hypothetical protein
MVPIPQIQISFERKLFKKELALFRQFSFFSYHGKTTQIDSILLRRSENILNLPTKATQIDCNI